MLLMLLLILLIHCPWVSIFLAPHQLLLVLLSGMICMGCIPPSCFFLALSQGPLCTKKKKKEKDKET